MEFREQAVELVRATGKTNAEVARDLGINDTTLAHSVKAETLGCLSAAGPDPPAK